MIDTAAKLLAAYVTGQRDFAGADLSGADLRGAYLSVANLSGANLSAANLSAAYLSGANLSGANLSVANLSVANLGVAYLRGAYLRGADLRGANLSIANLSIANLSVADLSGADLSVANLSGADLSVANLSAAYLRGANLSGAILPHFSIVPDNGAFVAYKKLRNGLVAELLVPDDAPRTSSLVGRKCRAAWVTVVAIFDGDNEVPEGFGTQDGTRYTVGATVVADDWDDDIRVECTHGIHFFITLAEAREYA